MGGNKQVDGFAAILRNERDISARFSPGGEIRMLTAASVPVQIVGRSEGVEVGAFDFHRRLRNLDLKAGGFGLFVKIGVGDTAFNEQVFISLLAVLVSKLCVIWSKKSLNRELM